MIYKMGYDSISSYDVSSIYKEIIAPVICDLLRAHQFKFDKISNLTIEEKENIFNKVNFSYMRKVYTKTFGEFDTIKLFTVNYQHPHLEKASSVGCILLPALLACERITNIGRYNKQEVENAALYGVETYQNICKEEARKSLLEICLIMDNIYSHLYSRLYLVKNKSHKTLYFRDVPDYIHFGQSLTDQIDIVRRTIDNINKEIDPKYIFTELKFKQVKIIQIAHIGQKILNLKNIEI